MDLSPIIAWLAPIAATLVTLAGQLWLNQRFKRSDEKREQDKAETEAKRKAEAEWQASVIGRLDEQDSRLDTVLSLQCSQTRSDILHKCHRYLDDIGKASTEEKEALKAEHKDYADICKANGIENEFIDLLVQRVMELPERDV